MLVHVAGIVRADPALALAKATQAQQLIVISSASAVVDGHPRRATVIEGESRLQDAVAATSILRPTMIYGGARDRNMRRLFNGLRRLPIVPRFSGGGRIMPVFVDDVVSAVMEVISDGCPACVRPVAGPKGVRMPDVIDELCLTMGKHRIPIAIPLTPIASAAGSISRDKSRLLHAMQMLAQDRVTEAPDIAGFRYAPTGTVDGLREAVRRYLGGRTGEGARAVEQA